MLPPAVKLSPDIWVLVFEQLAGDYVTLCNVSLVSRAWRTLSWPCLLKVVDLSSHNIGRLPEHEDSLEPVIYSSYHAKYRPQNLVFRQRRFLHLITAQPDLAKYVQSFTWTLIWRDEWHSYDGSPMLDIDRETWNVFSRLLNVTQLDLASIHDISDESITRENPPYLFPKVVDLRLLGWMHRGLVKAILDAIDATKLRSLKLDDLEDQGGLPGGHPMNTELAADFAKNSRRVSVSDVEYLIDDKLFQRQENGKAAVFPGPMWYPMRLLSGCSLDSLSHLQISVPQFDRELDVRNYYTSFREVARLLCKASSTIRSLTVIFGEPSMFYYRSDRECRGNRNRLESEYRPMCIKMAASFLKQVLIALSVCQFPKLTQLTFQGFHLLEGKRAGPDLGGTLPYIMSTRFSDVDFTGTSHVDGRFIFSGFDCVIPNFDAEVLRNS